MLDVLRAAALLAATMAMGIGAGVFQLYNFAIMPGLRRTDDRTFVGAFQQIDTAIIGPWLFLFFFGALGFTALAAALHFSADERSALPWIGGAFVLHLAVVVMTALHQKSVPGVTFDSGGTFGSSGTFGSGDTFDSSPRLLIQVVLLVQSLS